MYDFLIVIFSILIVTSGIGVLAPIIYMLENWLIINLKDEIKPILITFFVSALVLVILLITHLVMLDLHNKVVFYEKNISVEESYEYNKIKQENEKLKIGGKQ